MTPKPADPPIPCRYALKGRVVTMNENLEVIPTGVIYIDDGKIQAVSPAAAPKPSGFESAPLFSTGGTIYPGLIELHNHLSYNILPLWKVPKLFERREQWKNLPEKRKFITAPMQVLGKTADFVEAIIRYVESKCLLSGVTTSQGITLSGIGTVEYYKGLIRNVEETDDRDLPDANTLIEDVDDASKFFSKLQKIRSCLLLHLSEAVPGDDVGRMHFEALKLPNGEWAISDKFSGIHSTALNADDFKILAQKNGSMIWSPLSNYLLYGNTANIKSAKEAEVLMGIGSDWSSTGSKNLLCELKVAHLVNVSLGGIFTHPEIVAMATKNAAKILKWDKFLGSIEPGKHSDLLVLNGNQGDPYELLISANESSIKLVVIDGVPRFGYKGLMGRFGKNNLFMDFEKDTEKLRVGKKSRLMYLKDKAEDLSAGALKLSEAKKRLKGGLTRLADLAMKLENPVTTRSMLPRKGRSPLFLYLELDEQEERKFKSNLRRGLLAKKPTALLTYPKGVEPYSVLLKDVKIKLDPLTVVDDAEYFDNLNNQPNLPDFIKNDLPAFY